MHVTHYICFAWVLKPNYVRMHVRYGLDAIMWHFIEWNKMEGNVNRIENVKKKKKGSFSVHYVMKMLIPYEIIIPLDDRISIPLRK